MKNLPLLIAFLSLGLAQITPATVPQMVQLARLGNGVMRDVALAPDAETLAVASTIGVLLHHAENADNQPRLLEGQDGALSVAFSPGGDLIASGGQDNSIVLWDAVTGEETAHLLNHIYPVDGVLFSPDGALLASGDVSGMVRLWDVTTRTERAVFQSRGSQASMIFSEDGSILASGGAEKVRAWDVNTGEVLAEIIDPGQWSELTLQAGAQTLVLTAHQPALPWDEETSSRLYPGQLLRVEFGAENTLTSRAENDLLQTWDLTTLTLENSRLDPDPTRIPSFFHFSEDGTVEIRDPATGEIFVTFSGHTAPARTVSFSPDRKLVATGADDSTARLWNATTGEELAVLRGHLRGVSNVAFSPDGQLLASASYDATILLWNVETFERLAKLEGHTLGVTDVAFNREGTLLASASFDGSVRLWGIQD
jgi:WD40 repeat protein